MDRFFGAQGRGQLAYVIFLLLIFMGIYLSGTFSYDPVYNPVSDLVITNSTFQFDESKCGPEIKRITLIGTITNRTDIAFKDIVISVNYYDKAGQLIDVVHDEVYDLIVPPVTSKNFRVSGTCSQDQSLYAKAEASVTKAEPDGWL